ncbi:FAFL103Cp [Eremothecium gossypii FDAG1]|nr:FAFL103Cp [Eremothecium gossypii FDAG1]
MAGKDLKSLIERLNLSSSKDEHSQVAAAYLELVANGCDDVCGALEKCVTALIKQDRYEQAMEVFAEYADVCKEGRFALLKLYTFYKLGQSAAFETEWAQVAEKVEASLAQDTVTAELRPLLHVRAQFDYKMGRYSDMFRTYKYLAAHNEEEADDGMELACNERVPLAFLPAEAVAEVSGKLVEDSYDMLLNESMVCSSKGQLEQAESLLKRALELARAEEVEDDVHTIQLQLAYVTQLLGRKKESRKLLTDLQKQVSAVSPLVSIIKTNLKSLDDLSRYSENSNLPLVLRELDAERLASSSSKTYSHDQWLRLQANLLFMRLFSNTIIRSKSTILSRTLAQYSKLVDNVCLESYTVQAKTLFDHVLSLIAKKDENTVGVLVLAVQLQLKAKNIGRAILLCEKYWENMAAESHKELVSSLLVHLYKQTRRKRSLLRHLAEITESFDPVNVRQSYDYWKFIGFQLLENQLGSARDVFAALAEVRPADSLVAKVLNPADQHELSEDMITDLVRDIDVEALIANGVDPLEASCRIPKASAGKVSKKRRTGKPKLPKAFDPEKQPDPERWLPLRDRSSYRPKKRHGKQTQGGVVDKRAESNLDITKQKKKPKQKKAGHR